MAIKASTSITLSTIVDVKATYRYYLLQSSTLATPSKPTTFPPSSSWKSVEPTYTDGSTNSLYFVDCTVFCDDTFQYSAVSLSSAYEAAKQAFNKANEAAKTATNFMSYDATNGLQVGNKTNGTWSGFIAQIKAGEFNILDATGNKLARYAANVIELGLNATSAVVKFCKGKGIIAYENDSIEGKDYLNLKGENARLKGEKESALWASDKENGIGGKAVVKTYVDEENADYVATMYANDGESLEDDGDGYFGSVIKAMLKNGILMRTYSNIMAIARSTIELISNNSYIVLSALSGSIYLETGDKVYINEKPISDFVVEQGTSGIWTYRKWNSGVAECWGRYQPGSVASTTKWGNIYYGTISSVNFPSGLFNAAPITNCECENSNGWVIHNAPTATAFPSSYLCTATSITTTPYLSIRAIGKWK